MYMYAYTFGPWTQKQGDEDIRTEVESCAYSYEPGCEPAYPQRGTRLAVRGRPTDSTTTAPSNHDLFDRFWFFD